MKIWLIVALLAVATSVAVAAVAAEADSTKIAATKVIIEAETDLPPISSTDVAEDDEGSETTTESSAATADDEKNEKKKIKHEKSEPIKEGEPEEEEEEGENEEEENEESEEGDSDEDSEEEESKGKERKKTKIESEEEGDIHKEDAGKMKFPKHQPPPAEVPTRSRTFVAPAAASPVDQPDKTRELKWYFNSPSNSQSTDVLPPKANKVESPKLDFTETSTRAAVHHQVWSSSARPVAKSVAVETRPATTRPTDVTPSDTRKPHHPKWFFNTAKEKSSAADGSTKIESPKPTAIFEIATRKAAAAAAISIPSWPPSITTAKPASAVASNEPADFSHSDNRRSHSHWYFNTPSKPSADGLFAKKESNTSKPAAIEIPTRNGRPAGSSHRHATHPWTPSSSNWPVASVPVYKPALEVTPPPPRKQYPRWFFNIKS